MNSGKFNTKPTNQAIVNDYLFVLLFLCFSMLLPAQSYKLSHYADHNGLPSRIVRGCIQDFEGYLWVAGNNGLFKYDGRTFQSYYASMTDTIGLRDNRIQILELGKDSSIWVGTSKGLHRVKKGIVSYWPLKTENSSDKNITYIHTDDHGDIWVGTYTGLFRLRATKKFEAEQIQIPQKSQLVWGVSSDANERVWIVPGNGLFYNRDSKDGLKEVDLQFDLSIDVDKVDLYRCQQYHDSLFVLDSNLGLLKGVLVENDKMLVSYCVNKEDKKRGNYFLYFSTIDHLGNIWLATWRNNFVKLTYNEGFFEEDTLSIEGDLSMMGSHSISIFQDKDRNIWISNAQGLFKISPSMSEISTFPPSYKSSCYLEKYNVSRIFEDSCKHLLLSTQQGILVYKKEDILEGLCEKAPIYTANFPQVKDCHIDHMNRIWLSSTSGIHVAQLDDQCMPSNWTSFTSPDQIPHNWTYDIHQNKEKEFFVGSYSGLIKISLDQGSLEDPHIKVFQSKKEDETSIVNSLTTEIEKDQFESMWFGTSSGLSKLISSDSTGAFENYEYQFGASSSLSNSSIKDLLLDSEGRLWIATQRGLNLFIDSSNTFIRFGIEDGLSSEYILGLKEDSQGFIWMSTTMGVQRFRFDPLGPSIKIDKHCTLADGLLDNISNRKALHVDNQDYVFVGSRNGVSILGNRPNRERGLDAPLRISTLKYRSKKGERKVSILDQLKENRVQLPYTKNTLDLTYVALDLTAPEMIEYRHKLLGEDEEWINTGNRSEINLYRLSPNSYSLLLDAKVAGGSWNSQPLELIICIRPPFWQHPLAYLAYILLAIVIVRYYYKNKARNKLDKLKKEYAIQHRLLEEREAMRKGNAADFHDEVGSKVTKISLYLTLAERSLNEGKDALEWLKKIRFNTRELSSSFRDLLWVIDPTYDSLHDTFHRLKDFGQAVFDSLDIDFKCQLLHEENEDPPIDPSVRKHVLLLFKEAINNCIKYANATHVSLSMIHEGRFSTIVLEDDGNGFDVKRKSKGRGLKNMKERAAKIDALLEITSNKGGTRIYLSRIHHMDDVSLKQHV